MIGTISSHIHSPRMTKQEISCIPFILFHFVQMNGPQLRLWRKSQGLSGREVAEDILDGKVSQPTFSRWEASTDPIPEWAMVKLLGTTEVSLPLSELHQLLDIARQERNDFQEILGLAITAYLQSRSKAALSPTATEQESSRLNEDPTHYGEPSATHRKMASEAMILIHPEGEELPGLPIHP
jgi:transcriptional regulator with XRE-family HTH domain